MVVSSFGHKFHYLKCFEVGNLNIPLIYLQFEGPPIFVVVDNHQFNETLSYLEKQDSDFFNIAYLHTTLTVF